MKNTSIQIAVICGLIAALLFLSPIPLGGLGMILSSFTALPLFVVALGFGTTAGIISGVIAAIIVGVFFGPLGAFSVIAATLAPALWIGHSAGLSRDDTGTVEWFPISGLLLRLAAISAAIVIVIGVFSSYSTQWATDQATTIMKQFVQIQSEANNGLPVLSDEQIASRAADIAIMVPFMMPVSLLFLMVINLRLAERFVRARGWMLRPKDYLPAAVQLPPLAAAILGVSVVGSFMSNELGLIAKVIAGAFGGAFLLVGLATVHFITRGVAARSFLLPLTYVALFLSRIIAPAMAIIGVAETLFRLRDRFAAGQQKPKS